MGLKQEHDAVRQVVVDYLYLEGMIWGDEHRLRCQKHKLKERASMCEVSIIGVDLTKNVFQLHRAAADGSVVFRKKLSRSQFARFMAEHPPCLILTPTFLIWRAISAACSSSRSRS